MSRTRLIAFSASFATAGLLLAGCSSTTTEAPPVASTSGEASAPASSAPTTATSEAPTAMLSNAANATTEAGTAKFKGDVATGDTTIAMEGAIDFATSSMSLKVKSPLLGGDSAIDVVTVDGATYMMMPQLKGKWLKVPAKLAKTQFSNPADGLDSLKDLANLQEVGTEEINGVATTHYSGELSLKEALDQAQVPADQLDDMKKGLESVKDDATVDVWVDGEGRVVQMKNTMSVDVAGKTTDVSTNMSFTDFGAPVDIKAPPASDVMDSSQMGGLEGLVPQGE